MYRYTNISKYWSNHIRVLWIQMPFRLHKIHKQVANMIMIILLQKGFKHTTRKQRNDTTRCFSLRRWTHLSQS